jgi:hypothetical protein
MDPEAVNMMRDLAGKGLTTPEIADALNAAKTKAPRKGKWRPAHISSQLRLRGIPFMTIAEKQSGKKPTKKKSVDPEVLELMARLAGEGLNVRDIAGALRAEGLLHANGSEINTSFVCAILLHRKIPFNKVTSPAPERSAMRPRAYRWDFSADNLEVDDRYGR